MGNSKVIMLFLSIIFFYRPIMAEIQVDSYFRYIPSRTVEAQSGRIEILQSESQYSYEFKAFGKLPLKFFLGNEYIGIENTTGVKLPAHLVGLISDIETTLPFFSVDKTYLRLGLSPSFYGQDWTSRSSAFRIPSRTYLIYQPSEKWKFLFGVAFYPDFENEVLPILGFIYQPNDKLTFKITPKRPNISYDINDKITLFAEGGSAFSEFEVNKDNFRDVVLRYRQTHLGAGIKYKLNRFIESSLSCGGIFGRSLKYRDDSLGKVNIKNSVYTEIRLEIKI